jgi:hypothetical protein
MTSAAKRKQLHQYIDAIDDAKIEAIYHLVEKEPGHEKYTPEELAEFYDRLEKYNKGEMPVYSMEEAHNYVRLNKKSK